MMAYFPTAWAVQAGVYAALTSNGPLQTLFGGTVRAYDHPPADAVFPFITIGQSRMTDILEVDGATEHDIRVHVWSKWGGRKEVREILDATISALTEAELSLEGVTPVLMNFVFADVFKQPDAETFHGVARFRLLTERQEVAS